MRLRTFAGEAATGQAPPFVDLEMAEFIKKVPKERQSGAAADWMTRISGFLRKGVAEGVAAGQFLVPQITGAKRYQAEVTGLGFWWRWSPAAPPHGSEAAGQAKLMETRRRTGLESPVFAEVDGSMPMWEATVEMTKGLVDERHWETG